MWCVVCRNSNDWCHELVRYTYTKLFANIWAHHYRKKYDRVSIRKYYKE